jgi:xanthine dehydrogenase molybdenum-binding subunit
VLQAMSADAPLLHETLFTASLAGAAARPSNVASHFQQLVGDPAQGFAQAEVVVERELRTATVHQGYIEPHATTASWTPDGHLTLYTTTQGTFDARSQVAGPLGLPEAQVRVIATEVGGAFGGKNTQYVDVAAALLARKAGRPVKVVMSRAEVLLGSGPSSGTLTRLKVGARRDGRLTAARIELFYEAGAYPGSSVGGGASCMVAPYDIPHGQIDGYDVLVNKPRTGPYRAPGCTQAAFAMETVLDELAEKLGLDPLELRLRNVVHEGTETLMGHVHHSIAGEEVLRAAQGHAHYRAPLGGLHRGRGVAFAYWGNWGARSSAILNVHEDGTLSLVTGSVDVSGTRTSLAMQAAEALGLPLERIRSSTGDTDSMGHSDTSGGSRTTMATGVAVVEAAQDVIAQMKTRAAELWGVAAEAVAYQRGEFSAASDDGEQRMSFAELARMAAGLGGAVRGKSDVDVRRWGGAFAAHIVDVDVEPETGKVRVLRYTAVQDVGRAIHPGQVEGQIQGAVAQGIGWALYEGYAYDERGRLLNANLLDYKMPTALDVPPIEAVLLEYPYAGHPFGVRGVGEAPIVPPPAAIANAIYAATGARLTELPMTPERVLRGMGVL